MSFMAEIALVSLKCLKNSSHVRNTLKFVIHSILSATLVSTVAVSCNNGTPKITFYCCTRCNRFVIEGYYQANEVSVI